MSADPIEVFRAKALSVSGVSALVGTRVYPQNAPTNTAWPFVVVGVQSEAPAKHMTGSSNNVMAKITARIYAATNDAARAVATALRTGIGTFKGTVTVGVTAVTVDYLGLDNAEDEPIMNNDGNAVSAYTIRQDWSTTIAE